MQEHSYLDPNELKGLNLSIAAVEHYAVANGWQPVETSDPRSHTFLRTDSDSADRPATFVLPVRAEPIDQSELHVTLAKAISTIAAVEDNSPQETLAAIQAAVEVNPRQDATDPFGNGEANNLAGSNPLALTRARATLIEQPVFLVGAERSGTTLLRLMLDHHPEICWCSEFEYSVDTVAPNGIFPELGVYYKWLETNRVFRSTNFTIDRTRTYPQLVDDFLRQRQDLHQKPIVGATVHRNFDRLLYIWPDAKFIKILRDGRDVARSCVAMHWAGNLWRGADRWIEAETLWANMTRSLPQERYIEVRYEDLVSQPVESLAQICEFAGTTYDPAMLTYPENSTYTAPNPNLIFQWQQKLSKKEVQLVEARISDLLTERGYALSGLPIIEISPQRALRLHVHNYLLRIWGRVQNFGLPLLAISFLSRRLGLKPLERYATLRIQRKQQAQLK